MWSIASFSVVLSLACGAVTLLACHESACHFSSDFFGGEAGFFGGEASSLPPLVDETLIVSTAYWYNRK